MDGLEERQRDVVAHGDAERPQAHDVGAGQQDGEGEPPQLRVPAHHAAGLLAERHAALRVGAPVGPGSSLPSPTCVHTTHRAKMTT